MEEFVEEFEVPEFTKQKTLNGEVRYGIRRNSSDKMLSLRIYPDGDKPETEGKVSIAIAFDEFEYNLSMLTSFKTMSSFHCTVSVVDINGETRFPQSLGMDLDGDSYDVSVPVKLERFIERRLLLDSKDELLPGDTLRLRCDVVCWHKYKQKVLEEEAEKQRLYDIAREESWFNKTDESDDEFDDIDWRLDLSRPDSSLARNLREKSEFFENLFQMPSKREEDRHMRVDWIESSVFFDMLCFVRCGYFQNYADNRGYCSLYEMAAKYEVSELQEQCSEHLRQHMSYNIAVDALRIADLHSDPQLRHVAFRCILSNWDRRSRDNKIDLLDRHLRNQLICATQILQLEGWSRDRLSSLAAREVYANRQRVLHSPSWSVFAIEHPELAQVISSLDSDGYTLDLEYQADQDQLLSCDSYR